MILITSIRKQLIMMMFFILFTSGSSNISTLPPLMAIVDRNYWSSYFGPFVGRAFMLVQSNGFNVNNATYAELTAVTGIGPKRASDLIDQRTYKPFEDMKDCYQRTRIPYDVL